MHPSWYTYNDFEYFSHQVSYNLLVLSEVICLRMVLSWIEGRYLLFSVGFAFARRGEVDKTGVNRCVFSPMRGAR